MPRSLIATIKYLEYATKPGWYYWWAEDKEWIGPYETSERCDMNYRNRPLKGAVLNWDTPSPWAKGEKL